jgi:hypothetical protein
MLKKKKSCQMKKKEKKLPNEMSLQLSALVKIEAVSPPFSPFLIAYEKLQ